MSSPASLLSNSSITAPSGGISCKKPLVNTGRCLCCLLWSPLSSASSGPLSGASYLSFQRFTTVSKTTFVGIAELPFSVFQDSTFLHAFGFTAVFTVVSTVLINVLRLCHRAGAHPGHQGHQPVPHRVLYAQPHRRHPAGLHLADPAERRAGQPPEASAGAGRQGWLLWVWSS